jgi:palmitoyl-protein thioesterase
MQSIKFTIFILIISASLTLTALPVAVFHGISDSCIYNPGMTRFTQIFSDELKVYSRCIETGGGPEDWVTSIKSQAEKACEEIKKDTNFQGEFAVIGLSQGSLIARYIIEACDMKGTVKKYISIGGPQMGVGSFPQCTGGLFCKIVDKLVGKAIYFESVQNHVGPAGYFKDILQYDTYLKYSNFLADLNNEKTDKNNSYKERFSNLEKVLLIKFSKDTMIIPKETAWFQFYDENKKLVDLTESEFYKEDFIGLKKLNEEKKIDFLTFDGNHLHFTRDEIEKYMIPALS